MVEKTGAARSFLSNKYNKSKFVHKQRSNRLEVKNISELFMVYLCTKSWDTNLQFLQKHENGKGVNGFKKVPISEREIFFENLVCKQAVINCGFYYKLQRICHNCYMKPVGMPASYLGLHAHKNTIAVTANSRKLCCGRATNILTVAVIILLLQEEYGYLTTFYKKSITML
jgi:hypothetical protein